MQESIPIWIVTSPGGSITVYHDEKLARDIARDRGLPVQATQTYPLPSLGGDGDLEPMRIGFGS